jgi:hypothetical protein
VKFTVTPLGGGREALPRIVEGIVRYLQPPPQPTPGAGPEGPGTSGNGPSDYYADSGEEPGRWLGVGASAAGLDGVVDAEEFASVLAGRDPRTGERLITAQGSAGRRLKLGAGNHTRTAPDGRLLFGEDDVAAALGVTKVEVARMLDVGMQAAIGTVAAATLSTGTVPVSVPVSENRLVIGSYLVPIIEADGSRWVTGTELSRCTEEREVGTDPAAVAAAGLPDDQLPIAEAARIAGVTVQYLRGCASRWEKQQDRIEADLAAGRRPRRAYIVAFRGTKNRWIIQRQHLAQFLEHRRPPAVRVGYDLTLTTEKSLGVLAHERTARWRASTSLACTARGRSCCGSAHSLGVRADGLGARSASRETPFSRDVSEASRALTRITLRSPTVSTSRLATARPTTGPTCGCWVEARQTDAAPDT